jgi:hypothetical protein
MFKLQLDEAPLCSLKPLPAWTLRGEAASAVRATGMMREVDIFRR